MLEIIQKIVNNFHKPDSRLVVNYFDTCFEKNVLISYIVIPFRQGMSFSHTNSIESLEIAKIFKELEYNVDIINFDSFEEVDYSKYKVLFGFGDKLVNYFYFGGSKKAVTIYYGTGMHINYSNCQTLKRAKEVYAKKGVWLLNSCRLVEKSWAVQTSLVDCLIILGAKSVADTYRKYFNGKIYSLPLSFYDIVNVKEIFLQKNFSNSRNNFLWFGGGGAVHKGLDIVLDVFKKHPELHLYICGGFNDEKDFANVYKTELFETENIHNYGFISLKSNKFKRLMGICGFVVFPSCSEGGSASIVNCMACGVVPVVPDSAGIELKDFGFRMKSISSKDVESIVLKVNSISKDELRKRSYACAKFTQKNNSILNFSKQLKKILKEVLS